MNALSILRIVATATVVLLIGQTLFFKFTAAPESVELFTQLGLEPHGRIAIGLAELVAILLLVIPRTALYGALLSAGLMAGALLSHVTKLGFADDMGVLASLALVALISSVAVVWILRDRLPLIGPKKMHSIG